MLVTDNPVYVEYIDWYCQLNFSSFDSRYQLLHGNKFVEKTKNNKFFQKISNRVCSEKLELIT